MQDPLAAGCGIRGGGDGVHIQKDGVCSGWGVHPSLDVTTMLEGPQVDRKIADAFSTNHCQAPRDRESRRALWFFLFYLERVL